MYGAGYEFWSHDQTRFEDLPRGILMDDRAIEGYFDSYEDSALRYNAQRNKYNDPGYDWDHDN